MLNLPRLDDLDYQKLWDRARAMAPVLAPEWTDLNDHDSGVTTLQAFAWLCDSLNYYINATGEAHRLAGVRAVQKPEQRPPPLPRALPRGVPRAVRGRALPARRDPASGGRHGL